MISELGAVITPLGLGEIYSGPSERNETGLCDPTCNKRQEKKVTTRTGNEFGRVQDKPNTQ